MDNADQRLTSSSHNSEAFSDKNNEEKNKKRSTPSLNKKCSGYYLVKDCEISPDDEIKRRLEKLPSENSKKKELNATRVAALIQPSPTSLSGQQQTVMSLLSEKDARAQPPQSAVVMADLRRYRFTCRVDSGGNELDVLVIIVNFLNTTSVFLPTLNKALSFKTVDGRAVHSFRHVRISPSLYTSARKCRLRNLSMNMGHDRDTTVRNEAVCDGKPVLRNPFSLYAGLNITDLVASNFERLSLVDYSYVYKNGKTGKIGKLDSELTTQSRRSEAQNAFLEVPNARAVANDNILAQEGDSIDHKGVKAGVQDESELREPIGGMRNSGEKHLQRQYHEELWQFTTESVDGFCTRLGKDISVDAPPMKIEFDGKERLMKVCQWIYSPKQLLFLHKTCDELMAFGFIFRNPNSKWACAPVNAPKNGPKGFWFTVNIRSIII